MSFDFNNIARACSPFKMINKEARGFCQWVHVNLDDHMKKTERLDWVHVNYQRGMTRPEGSCWITGLETNK